MIALWALALAGDPFTEQSPCDTTPLPGYRYLVATADGRGLGDADARERAYSTAREQLLAGVCGASSGPREVRCAAARRQVDRFGDAWDPKLKTACARAAIKEEWLDAIDRDAADLEGDTARLSAEVARRVGTGLLSLEPPVLPSGCVAGDVGWALAARLRNQLAVAGATGLLGTQDARPGAAELRLSITPAAGTVVVNATLLLPGAAATEALPGFEFPIDLFDWTAEEAGACRDDAALALDGGARTGEGGLRVTVAVPTRDGLLCEGDQVTPVLRASREAEVQLFSVDQHGIAYLVWPERGAGGLVRGELSLPTSVAVPFPESGDERLVAVAVLGSRAFERSRGWQGPCRVPGAFGPFVYPAGGGVGTATFSVLPRGAGACPEATPTPAAVIDGARRALAEVPVCGAAR